MSAVDDLVAQYAHLTDHRVEVPAYTDQWMQGDRYGEVVKLLRPNAYFLPVWVEVRLDKSGKVRKFLAADVTEED